MKTFKRIASLILAIAMISAMVVMPAQAAEKVFKHWTFDDGAMPAELTAVPDGKILDGGLMRSRGNTSQNITFGSLTAPLNIKLADYPYLEMDWSYKIYSGKENAAKNDMWFNLFDASNKIIAQIQFGADSNGVKVSEERKVHTYEFAKATLVNPATTNGYAKSIEEVLNTEIAFFRMQPWYRNDDKATYGEVCFDYIKIFGYDLDIAVSAPTAVYSGDTAQITATVTGNTPDKVDFYVDGELAGTATSAPYSLSYKFEGEKKVNIKVVATAGNNTVENSTTTDVMQSGRVDFDSYVPPHILSNKATISEAGEMVYSGAAQPMNVGTTSYSFVKGGADLTEKKYLKMRMKLSGAPKTDRFMVSFTVRSPGNKEVYCTLTANEDINGKTFSTEYQQLVFDLTKCPVAEKTYPYDFTDKPVGIIEMYPMRTVSTGTLTIDWIELSDDPTVEDEKPTIVALAADKTSGYAGTEVNFTASVEGTVPEKIEFYADGELFATDDTTPYTAKYTLSGEKNYNFTAKGVSGNNATESTGVAVTSFNELRMDFNETIPPHFGRSGATLDGAGAVTYTGATSTTINIGIPSISIAKDGFDPTEYKYLKMRAKLELTEDGEPRSDGTTVAITAYPVGASGAGGTEYCQLKPATDINGRILNENYQELIFDLTKTPISDGSIFDFTGKKIGWLQLRPFCKVTKGKLSIDWIELSNEAEMSVNISADKKSALSGTEVTITSAVSGIAADKVEFYANGNLISTDDTAPYNATYTVTGEKLYKFTAKGYAGEKVTESGIAEVTSYDEYRMDFNELIPPHFGRSGAALDGNGAVTYTGATSTTINIGIPSISIAKDGFDPTEYRFLKMRAKLELTEDGEPRSDGTTVAITAYPVGASGAGGTEYCQLKPATDINGRILNENYQELIFDLTKTPTSDFDFTDKKIGWLQLRPFCKVTKGKLSIDYIEISKEPVVSLTADKSGAFREGVEVTLTADVVGAEADSVKFYDGDKLIGEDASAPYSIVYKAEGDEKHTIVAKAVSGSNVYESIPAEFATYTELRMDFDTSIAPNFSSSSPAELDGEGAVVITGEWNTMLGIGKDADPIKVGGFDPTEYKYMKIRAKLTGTPKVDPYTLSFDMFDVGGTTNFGTFTYVTDMYGKTFTEEYQELIFDLTNGIDPATGEVVDISGKTAGRLRIMPMRKANPAVMHIDYIEFISAKPYKIGTPELAGDKILTSTVLNDNMDEVVDTDSIVYIAAKYNGNDLTDVKLSPVTLTENKEDTTPIDVSAMEIADGERIDVMAVKSFSDMTPIMDKVTVYDNGISAKDAAFAGAFMDHMVLQRDMPVNVWGKADAADGGVLEISFAGNTVSATVENGKWQAKLPALKMSAEPQVLSVKSLAGIKEISDVLVGDVYLIGGQSNAQFTLNGTDTWEADRENAVPEDNIRILFAAQNEEQPGYSEVKRDDPYPKAMWQIAEDKTEAEAGWDKYGHTMVNFPAIGYYMADTLRADGIDVPLGLVSFAKSGATLAQLSPAHLSEGINDSYKAQAYNGLLAPVENMTAKGMLWYQGESDSNNDNLTASYEERFSNFVDYMRGTTGNSNMPVFMVQLSSHLDQAGGTTSTWQLGQFRSMQTDMILNKNIDNLYMVASLDKGWKKDDGDSDNALAHPKYKKPVGERLAKVVENVLYNGDNATMPMPVSVDFEEGYCTITFDREFPKMYLEPDEERPVYGFELIKDGVAYPASAEVYGDNTVDVFVEDNEVLCNGIADGVRYAFFNAASPLVAPLVSVDGYYAPTFAIDNPDVNVQTKAAYIDPISWGKAE